MQRSISVRLSVAMLVGALCVLNLWAANDVQTQLNAEYNNKVLSLRQPYSGERLQFGADGKLLGDAKVGPWTVDGQVEVKNVTLVDRSLKIEGRRVRLFFDPFKRQFRDIASVSQGDKAASLFKTFRDQRRWKEVVDQPVEIDVELVSESPDYKEISLATEAIFLNPSESLVDVLPSYWRSYLADKNRGLEVEPEFREDLYEIHQDGVSPPTPVLTPDPQYSEAARQVGFQGQVTMSLIVDKDGNPKDIRVVNPTGLGLDEESVNAVHQWKFRPGQKQGRTVNVQLSVEISFHLYGWSYSADCWRNQPGFATRGHVSRGWFNNPGPLSSKLFLCL
jgi:TonB family protein